MIKHFDLGDTPLDRLVSINAMIRRGEITLAGNRKAKIYGLLSCSSGKRLRVKNRVFFKSESEALKEGFRPCCHCMNKKFVQWKKEQEVE